VTVTPESRVDHALLNLLGAPQVVLEEAGLIGPGFIDMEAMRDALENAISPENYFRRSNFHHDEWVNATGLIAGPDTWTENALDWYVKPTGASVNYVRIESGPDERGTYAAQLVGATGVTTVDFGTWVPAAVAGELKGDVLAFSVWVKNATGAAINVRLAAQTSTVLDGMADAVDFLVGDNIPIGSGLWVRCELTVDAAASGNFKNGCMFLLRTTALTSNVKSLEIAQGQLEIGETATAYVRPTLPAIPKDTVIVYPDVALETTGAPFDIVLQDRATGKKVYLANPPALFATPVLGFDRATGRPKWIDTTGNKQVFNYTGADQLLTVPEGAVSMVIYAWGAGGCNDAPGDTGAIKGGVGGYSRCTFVVTAGAQYTVMVGEGAHALARRTYGFGGAGQGAAHQHNGGGLTGIFTGTGAVAATDFARALVIAGGGGAAGQSGGGGNAAQGGNGNEAAWSGTTADFQGVDSVGGVTSGNGGGGGGRYGGQGLGLGGKGGTGFCHTAATPNGGAHVNGTAELVSSAIRPSLTVPGSTLDEYVNPAGQSGRPGVLVVVFS